MEQVGAVEVGCARLDAARWLRDEPHQRITGDRLARARFADDAQDLAPLDVETHVVHRPRDPVTGMEGDAQVFDFEERHVRLIF